MVICWLFLGPVYVTWAFCTWACQLCACLCILDLAFDSLYEGTVLCLFEFVLWCFLLATADLLERCFCYLCDVFVSSCFYLSMSKCKLQIVGIFSMGRICMSILAQVTHVWLIFSFLVGRHFGLVGIEAFVEGFGLPLAWSIAVLDVLLLLFSAFFLANQIFTDFLMQFSCIFWHLLFDLCALLRIFYALLCTFYALFMHFLCTFCVLFMHFLCAFYALFMHFLCAFYALFKSA